MEDKQNIKNLIEGFDSLNLTPEKDENGKTVKKKISLEQCLALFKIVNTMKIMKSDKEAVEILDGLFIGTFATSKNKEILQTNQITHILIVASTLKPEFPEDFVYKTVDILDTPAANLKQHFDECSEFIENCLKNQGKILVHCFAGKSRSSSIIIAYLIRYRSLSFEEAYKLVKSKREVIQPNEGFVRQLKEYREEINKRLNNN